MPTVICQGLHSSFLDSPQKAEPPLPVTLRLKLATTPRPADLAVWSFLQFSSTDNSSQEPIVTPVRAKDLYTPPTARHSSVKLSDRSLQLCTENLGNETGTDLIEGDSILTDVRNSELPREPAVMTRQLSGGKKVNPPQEIPPPLTTLRGAKTLQVRAHREDGRLVLNAVKSPSKSPGFVTERANGRLRLSLLREDAPDTDILDSSSCDHEETNDELQESESGGEDQTRLISTHTEFSHEPAEKGIEYRIGEGDGHNSFINTESLSFAEGDPRDHEDGEIMTEKLIQRPIIRRMRCNEGDHDHHHHHHQNNMLLSWEPLWVATS